jgi:hypothetical protein
MTSRRKAPNELFRRREHGRSLASDPAGVTRLYEHGLKDERQEGSHAAPRCSEGLVRSWTYARRNVAEAQAIARSTPHVRGNIARRRLRGVRAQQSGVASHTGHAGGSGTRAESEQPGCWDYSDSLLARTSLSTLRGRRPFGSRSSSRRASFQFFVGCPVKRFEDPHPY